MEDVGGGPFPDVRNKVNLELVRDKIPTVTKADEPDGGEPGKVYPTGIRITHIKDVTNYKGFEYKGFKICRSNFNGRWWIMSPRQEFCGYAVDYIDGQNQVDFIIHRGAEK